MKWIGQHIWDFISRFRSDVYLESVDSGTIASGGNLGLDSNNKIVKSASPAGTIDLTSEVTGTLPVGSGGTGATTLADNSVLTGTGTSAITAEAGFTYQNSLVTLTASSSGNLPALLLHNDNAGADGGLIQFNKLQDGSDDDELGIISWMGDDDGGTQTQFASMTGFIADATGTFANDEAGKLDIKVASEATMRQALTATGGGTSSKVDIGLGYGTDSTTSVAGNLSARNGNFTYANDSLLLESSVTNKPGLILENTNTDATSSLIEFYKNSNGDGDDLLGDIYFKGKDDGGGSHIFAQINSSIVSASAGSETGKLSFKVAEYDGTVTDGLTLTGTDTNGEIDVTIGSGAGSKITVDGQLWLNGSNGKIYAPSDSSLQLYADQHMDFFIDADNDETMYFRWYGNGSSINESLMFLGDDGVLQVGGLGSATPQVKILDYANDANGPDLIFYKQRGSTAADGQDNDVVGVIKFTSYDDGTPTEQVYGGITTSIADATSDDEAGKMQITVATEAVNRQVLTATGDGASSKVDVSLGYGTSSVTTLAGDLDIDGDGITSAGALTLNPSGLLKTTATGVEIENDSASGQTALIIDNDDVDAFALGIHADNTTANVVDVRAEDLTTANAININCDSLTNGQAIKIDWDDAVVTDQNRNGVFYVDYDRSGDIQAGQGITAKGIEVDLRDSATSHASDGTMVMTGVTSNIYSVSDSAIATNTAFDGVATGADTNYGLQLKAEDTKGADIKMMSSASSDDYCTIACSTNGETTITTVEDGGGSTAHFEIAADGNIILDSAGDIALEAAGGNLTCDAAALAFNNSNANAPTFRITNNANDATGPKIILKNNRDGNGLEDDDVLGDITFQGEDASGNDQAYGSIVGGVVESDDGDEAGKISINVANDGTERNGITMSGDAGTAQEVDVTIANGRYSETTIAGDLTVISNANIPTRKFTKTSSTHHEWQGDVVYFGTAGSTYAQGDICYLHTDASWVSAIADADNDGTGKLLAVALGSDPAVHGMLLRGMITLDHNTGNSNDGEPVYLSTTTAGQGSSIAPSSTNNIVRIIGYKMGDDDEIWFNPDTTWIEHA